MKSIIVKTKNGVASYSSGWKTGYREDGTPYTIEETDEEMWQSVYQSLISDIKRKEFDKNLIAILKNYEEHRMDNWKNIQIKITGDWSCEMNISNPENMDWQKMELPEIEGK